MLLFNRIYLQIKHLYTSNDEIVAQMKFYIKLQGD